jgi:hypothetical protein
LEHYLRSLDLVEAWAQGIRLTFGGHKPPIDDLPARISEIRQLHRERLETIRHILREPHTVVEVSQALFGEPAGYTALLAIEETGAHVEYLYQHGQLGIHNLSEIEPSEHPTAIRYIHLPVTPPPIM